MKLIQVTVKKFRNIIDSNAVSMDNEITCLVGKNESGKTSFLHALYRLNPVRQNAKFIIEDQYPAWLEKKDKLKGIDLNKVRPISAKFEISKNTVEKIEQQFGENLFISNYLELEKSYDDTLYYNLQIDEKAAIKHLLKDLSFTRETRSEINKIDNIQELKSFIDSSEIEENDENSKDNDSLNILLQRIKDTYETKTLDEVIWEKLKVKVPKFIYFDKYSTLPYSIKIRDILKADPNNLKDDELTALALLRIAAADDDYLLNPDYERRKRELENVANAITQDVLKYWSQNQELRVSPDITQITVNKPNGQTTVLDELKIRIWDNKHFLSLPFNEHSTGFQWFFSFLAAFSEYEYKDENIILLLDEPGLGLHGKAQADFLRFIEERLAPRCQVIYTTHSPFMVQPNHLERARIVEEKEKEEGTKITEDVLTTDPDTLFPLQGALGYDLIQHLFISKNNLIVEGTSDYTYLILLSEYLKNQNRTFLNENWSIVPVGGADLIPTFVALLGTHLDITVVVDARKEGHQKLSNLASKGYLANKKIITLNEITGTKLADIEDLFEINDYLKIYNKAFDKKIKPEDLKGTDPLVSRIARFEGVERFDHGRPADEFLKNKMDYIDKLSADTYNNFEKLFDKINSTFEE